MTRNSSRAPAALLGLLRGIKCQMREKVPFSISTANGGIDGARAVQYFSAGSNGGTAFAVRQQDGHFERARTECPLPGCGNIHSAQGLARSAVKGTSQCSECWAPPNRGFATTSTAHRSPPQIAAVPQSRGHNQGGIPRHVQPTSSLSSQGQTQADSGGRALSAGGQLTAGESGPREGSGTGGNAGNARPVTAREAGVMMKAAIRRGDVAAVHAAFDPSLPVRYS